MAFLIPYSLITKGIYSVFVTSIGTITMGTYKVIASIYSHKNEDVKHSIKKLDIERKLSLIESIMKYKKLHTDKNFIHEDIEENTKNSTDVVEYNDSDNTDHPIHLCLTALSSIMKTIHKDLKLIDQKVKRHNTKWFKSYRSINVTNELEKLETDVKILDTRFDDLIKISNLIKE
jgi:hypothetical protein